MNENGWTRRGMLSAAAMVAASSAFPGGGALLRRLDPGDAPSTHQRKLMRAAADLVIPATQTPGAAMVGAGDFAIIALAHGLDGTRAPVTDPALQPFLRRDGSLNHVRWLEQRLNGQAGGNWLGKPKAQQGMILTLLDASAYGGDADASPWRAIKGLILMGYYTSEAGASQEQQYELTPGRYDPKVPLASGARAFSSDWTAVDFG